MGLRRGLRDLDRRLIPPLAAAFGWLSGGAKRRLLGTAVLVVAALAVAGALAVRDRPVEPEPATTRVGLAAGEPVSSYVADSRGDLSRLARSGDPDRPVYALVSLSAYLSPARLRPVLAGVRAERAYTRVPLPGYPAPVAAVEARRVPADVVAGMDRLAADRNRISTDFGRLAASPGPQRGQYRSEQRVYRAQAEAYAGHCSCVFAALVSGRPGALTRLAARPGVRAVEPARAGTRLDRLVVAPLLPEQSGDDPSTPPSPSPVPSGSAPGPADPSPSPSGSTPASVPTSPSPSADPPSSPAGAPGAAEPSAEVTGGG